MARRSLLILVAAAACSGQLCGNQTGSTGDGDTNICSRRWFDPTFRVAWNPPAGIGSPRIGTSVASAALHRVWTWKATNPDTELALVVFEPLAEKTLAEFREAWLDVLRQNGGFTVLNETYVTLSDSAQGWYLAVSPADDAGLITEYVMTVTQERLVYVNAVYGVNAVTDSQEKEIGDALISLCADLE